MMPRLALLPALAAVLLAGCDGPVAPERTNPYDPAFDGPRRASAPEALVVVASGPTSVTVGWDDPNSFETGFEVLIGAYPFGADDAFGRERLPENTTRYELDGLVSVDRRVVRVRTLGDGGQPSSFTRPLVVRYPDADSTLYITGGDGVALPGARLAYRGARPQDAPTVRAYTLTFAEGGVSRVLGEIAGYDRIVGAVAANAVLAERVEDGQTERPVARIRGAEATATAVVRSPDGPITTPSVVAGDGSAMAALYEPSAGGVRLAVWNPLTGALLADAPTPADARLQTVTRAGTVVFEIVGPFDARGRALVGWDPATGTELWRRSGTVWPQAADPGADRIALVQGSEIEVLDADSGAILAVVGVGSLRTFWGLRDGLLLTGRGHRSRSDLYVWSVETGDLVRTWELVGQSPSDFGLVGDDLVLFDGNGALGLATRRPLRADWERDLAAEATLDR